MVLKLKLQVEKRIYVNIIGGELFVASAHLDYAEDNTVVATPKDINLDDITHTTSWFNRGGSGLQHI